MNKKPYKGAAGCYMYPELPDGMRPATRRDLLTDRDGIRYGAKALVHDQLGGEAYMAITLQRHHTAEMLNFMLEQGTAYVKGEPT